MSAATTVKEVLIAARWIIAHMGWCQGSYGRDKDGYGVRASGLQEHATSFCSLGAISVVEVDNGALHYQAEHLLRETIANSISGWNDKSKQTKANILRGFDKAIMASQ